MRIGIRTRVILLVLISALPLVLADLYRAEQARRKALDDARQEALMVARGMGVATADIINNARHLLTGFAARAAAEPEDLFGSRCTAGLRALLDANPAYRNIAVADQKGDIHCAAKPLDRPINVSDRQYFRQAIASSDFTLSEPLNARDGGGLLMVAARPIGSRASISGVLIASFDAGRLSEAFVKARPPEYVVAKLSDAEGHIIARWPFAPKLVGTFDEKIVRQPADSREGFVDLVDSHGVAQVSVYARVADVSRALYITAGIPRERIERAPRAMLQRDLLWLAAIVLLAVGVGFIGAHSLVVSPVRRLTAAARRYAAGDLGARSGLRHDSDEIGKLAAAFDTLATENQRVNRAFKALSGGNQVLLRAVNEPELLEAMCRNAVERAGYKLAFVNYALYDEHKSVQTVAKIGHDDGFVAGLQMTWADSERGRGTVGTAIREGRTALIRSMPTDSRFAPWRDAAIANGFGSVASFPLRVDGAVIGTFTLVASEENAFDASEQKLLDEMACDLAFGIQNIRSNSRRLAAEAAAARATSHDALTGLPGRSMLTQTLERAIRSAAAGNESLAAMVIHLPHLQDLHDSLGADASNAAIVEAAQRLRFVTISAGHLARLSADEFCLLVSKADAATLPELAARMQGLLDHPVDVKGVPVRMRAAVGASLYPAHGEEPEILLRRAVIAAREGARRELGFYLYNGATERENPDRLALASDLRAAITERALRLHLQPKVNLSSGAVCGAEALLRWPHPERGMVPPMQFVTIAEQTGLIRPMTSAVIELALQQLVAWRDRPGRIPIAINLSPRNLHDPGLVDEIAGGLDRAGVPPSLLEIEITETALAQDPEHARQALQKLRDLGCKLYVDDFGTGYSSLSYLVALPLDAIKIDRSFVRQMARSRESRSVVASIVLMARELGLRTVAEGVETQEDAALLREIGCDEAQGYFFGRPVPPSEFGRL